jgi:hypothetical protein
MGMMKRTAVSLAAVICSLAATQVSAQEPPTLQTLKAEIDELRRQMAEQQRQHQAEKEELEDQIDELRGQVEDTDPDALAELIDENVRRNVKFFARPSITDPRPPLFDSLQGGLILTGLFRSRFEWRKNNVDFNSDGDGLDDSGTRFNGRFRLGFGAVLVDKGGTGEFISALTEFQAVGSYANNSYINIPGPSGTIPLPSAFNILTEPFEEVSLYQGYLQFDRLLHRSIYLKVGRQEMFFGNQFVMGNDEFFDGTVQDGILVDWKPDEVVWLSAFFVKEAASDNVDTISSGIADFDEDYFTGVYLRVRPDLDMSLEAYAMYFDARSGDTDLFLTGGTAPAFDGSLNPVILGSFWTLGARLFWTDIDFVGGVLTLNAEGAYQTGSSRRDYDGLDQSIHGWSAEFIANWRLNDPDLWNPIITVAYYYAQGGRKGDGPNEVAYSGFLRQIGWQPLFINRHFLVRVSDRDDRLKPYYPGGGRYGNMDEVPLSNVHIVKAGLSFQPVDKVEFGLTWLMAITADDEGYGTGIYGQEIDLFAAYEYSRSIQFSANFGVFFPRKPAERLSQLLFFPAAGETTSSDDPAYAFYLQALIEF